MSGFTNGLWKYRKNPEGTFSVFPADSLTDGGYAKTLIAEIFTEGIDDPEANARLSSSAPEMYQALIYTNQVLRATEVFLVAQGLDVQEVNEIISTVEDLLDRIDGELEA